MSHATSTPSIRIYDSGTHHGRFPVSRRSSSYTSSSAVPMPIPNARESPPPPLPPPRHISELSNGHDPGWQWGNAPNGAGFGRTSFGSVKPGSSLWGGSQGKHEKFGDGGDRFDFGMSRRGSSISTITPADTDMADSVDLSDEDRSGLRRPSLTNHSRLQSETQLGQRSLQNSSHAYDQQLLSKIGNPNTPGRPASFLSAGAQDGSPRSHHNINRLNGQLKPLSMPERRYSGIDSPASRWSGGPSSGNNSPGLSGSRSVNYEQNCIDPALSRSAGNISAASSAEDSPSGLGKAQQNGDEHSVFMDHDFAMEENGMRDLNINDRSPSAFEDYQLSHKPGLKRVAASPPAEASREDRTSTGSENDLYRRRSNQMLNRSSPVQRFHEKHGSLSSTASSQRTGSYASSWNTNLSAASSATSYSGERLSPGTMSPSVDTEFASASPYLTNGSLNPSPRGSISKNLQHRSPSEHVPSSNRKLSTDSLPQSRNNSVSRIPGLYICQCCPKKPKKFDGQEELRMHELEKQYTCQYCPNRFKNKNEAERHQNSLHLRRHSWSCAALAGPHAAFHPSTAHPTTADVCGYCGDEFANPPNWDARADHLNYVHKFGECNQAKKFFRADHFRQHLKHSHAGTSGKWTNMLENACMKDEPAPAPVTATTAKERMGSVGSTIGGAAASPGGGMNGLAAGGKPGVIDEVHDES